MRHSGGYLCFSFKEESLEFNPTGSSQVNYIVRIILASVLFLCPFGLFGHFAGAQDEVIEGESPRSLEPVVVTGTLNPASLSQTPASVTVITREQIEERNPSSVAEILQQVPGLYVDQPASRGGVTSVYIRGGDPNFTLVLIDGVKVNDPTNNRGGSFDFSTLSPDNIERIEIVRDPMSSLYGSDALSGVINIVTKKGEGKPSAFAEGSYGRYGQYGFLGGVSGAGDFYNYSLSGSWLDDGEQVEGSSFKSPSFTGRLGVLNNRNFEINSTVRYSHVESSSFPDDSGGPEYAVLRSVDERNIDQLLLGVDLTHDVLPWWEYRLELAYYNNKEKFSSPGVAPGIRDPFGIPANSSDSDFKRYDANFVNTFTIREGVVLAAGFEAEIEDGKSTGEIMLDGPVPSDFSLTRYILSPYAELQFSAVENLYAVLGARLDFPEGFSDAFSPRAGLTYRIAATDTTLRANWGKGFKLPSFFSLSSPIVGNPDLVPEKSESLDVGVSQRVWGGRAGGQVNLYYNRFKNLIDFDEGPPPVLVNRSKVTVKGFELIGDVNPWDPLTLSGSVTYADSNIEGTDEELRNRPKWFGGFSVEFRPDRSLSMVLDAVFTGKVNDSSIPTGDVVLDSYTSLDFTATWTPSPNVRVFLAVENLLNAEYEQYVGFPAPGISPRAGLRLTY